MSSDINMLLPIIDIEKVLKTFESETESMKHTICEQAVEISNLNRCLDKKNHEILLLKRENKELIKRLSQYEKPQKDSHNSSIPPSRESIVGREIRRTTSLRAKSTRPSGGQLGHKGVTLEQVSKPTETHNHYPDFCQCCGVSLSDVPVELLGKRQVIDLPEIKPVLKEHRIYGKQCKCGCLNKGEFPKEARSPICYGPNIRSLVAYLSVVQCIPYERLCETLDECFNVHLSQGTIDNILESMREFSDEMYEEIRLRIEKSSVVGADETGLEVNGEQHWGWVFQTDKLTYIYQDASRGKKAINGHFSDGLPGATLVTDRYSSYFGFLVKDHQICLAHLLRDLTYLSELDQSQNWSSDLMKLFQEAIHKRKTLEWEDIPRAEILKRFEDLLQRPLYTLHEDFSRMQRSLLKHQDNVFRFLSDTQIPYDNNASERAIRIVKVKQKVSGSFRADKGADRYTQILSIADTSRKNRMSRFKALGLIARRE